ncbi:MAG: magnesium protoporphyrin IX methyltransferase [Aestuariivita sp.]|nr:magnesium protoporphyrin IX methyltransferase [Aestuariivita sp.]MCY4203947.1 magnesium protoporphyrin IX methyltransferase [Aestuariivita sp.]
MTTYSLTLARVETYFDKTATRTWERLTSDAPVSRVRQSVRAGRDQMRSLLLGQLPENLSGQRILDAGCGAGQMAIELARRGATVVGCDVSPRLLEVAQRRTPSELVHKISYESGDMLRHSFGSFDHAIAMDSLIYYSVPDVAAALGAISKQVSGKLLFSLAPRTKMLLAMWSVGKLFPRSDRSPMIVPHSVAQLREDLIRAKVERNLRPLQTVRSGFYISQALELEP